MINGSDRSFNYQGEASAVDFHLDQANRAINEIERARETSERLLHLSSSRKEIPESLQKALAHKHEELELLRNTTLVSMQTAVEAIKRMDTVPPLFRERHRATLVKFVALTGRLDATCEKLGTEMDKPIEVTEDGDQH